MSTNALTESGGSLRDRRRRIGLSQQTLADLADCSISMVRLLERGYEPAGSATRARVVAILDALTLQTKRGPGGSPDRVKASEDGARDES